MEEKSLISTYLEKLEEVVPQVEERIQRCAKAISWAKPISPTCAPRPWFCINVACCLGTAAFLVFGLQRNATVELWYVPFNMIICVSWLAEAALWMLFDKGDALWQKSFELSLAMYYIVDGTIYYYDWAVRGIPPTYSDVIFYSVIDILIYVYYFAITWYPDLLDGFIPSDPSAFFDMASYKHIISAARKFFLWWLPTAATLMWLTCSQNWSDFGGMPLALLANSQKGSALFLASPTDVGSSMSLLRTF